MLKKTFCVYILLCANNTFYTGYTDDLRRRYRSHVEGTGRCKYTRSFKPIAIARSWVVLGDKGLAMSAERFIKQLTKDEKRAYISRPNKLAQHFPVKYMRKNELAIIASLNK